MANKRVMAAETIINHLIISILLIVQLIGILIENIQDLTETAVIGKKEVIIIETIEIEKGIQIEMILRGGIRILKDLRLRE